MSYLIRKGTVIGNMIDKGMGFDGAKLGEAARSYVLILFSVSLQEERPSLPP